MCIHHRPLQDVCAAFATQVDRQPVLHWQSSILRTRVVFYTSVHSRVILWSLVLLLTLPDSPTTADSTADVFSVPLALMLTHCCMSKWCLFPGTVVVLQTQIGNFDNLLISPKWSYIGLHSCRIMSYESESDSPKLSCQNSSACVGLLTLLPSHCNAMGRAFLPLESTLSML